MSTPVLLAPIPAHAGPRLVRALDAFVRSGYEALAAGGANPVHSARWSRALSLLDRDRAALQAAAPEPTALLAHASRLRFLARQMDGYRLDFAGPALARRLEMERRSVVLAAWQIVAVASGSGASGL